MASDGSEDMLQITPEHRAQLADKSDQTRKRKETGTWTSTGTKKTRTQTSDSSDTHHLDTGMLGKRVMVDTVGTRGKKYGSQEARIVVIEDNNYKAQYTTWPSHFAYFNYLSSQDVIIIDDATVPDSAGK